MKILYIKSFITKKIITMSENTKRPHSIQKCIIQVMQHPNYSKTCTEFQRQLEQWNGISDSPYIQKKHNLLLRKVWEHFYLGNAAPKDIYGHFIR